MSKISSPCILVCVIDNKSGYCFGCGRTSLEISDWADYDNEKRNLIMAELGNRLKTIIRTPRRMTKRGKMALKKANSSNNKQRK